jgi:DNA repair ATPase RecN
MQTQSNEPTLEERVARLEQRIDQLDRIEQRLTNVEAAVVGLRTDFQSFHREFSEFRVEQAHILERVLASIDGLQRRRIMFRWPWEPMTP